MKNIVYKFLRCNVSEDYNFEMNDNNVADQYRLVYCIQRFQRIFKWWWALWHWLMEVPIINGYIMLKRYCELVGVDIPYTHHDFQEKIAHALLNPSTWQRRVRQSPPPLHLKSGMVTTILQPAPRLLGSVQSLSPLTEER
mmetsp:Transcript_34408/g.74375  ORF Transcript_34408/g.74375 Transcript_34408/m.74375 type:complete len:140 (-) Transcript_34408:150-569(-)